MSRHLQEAPTSQAAHVWYCALDGQSEVKGQSEVNEQSEAIEQSGMN